MEAVCETPSLLQVSRPSSQRHCRNWISNCVNILETVGHIVYMDVVKAMQFFKKQTGPLVK